jgi:hypothetical protein
MSFPNGRGKVDPRFGRVFALELNLNPPAGASGSSREARGFVHGSFESQSRGGAKGCWRSRSPGRTALSRGPRSAGPAQESAGGGVALFLRGALGDATATPPPRNGAGPKRMDAKVAEAVAGSIGSARPLPWTTAPVQAVRFGRCRRTRPG